jgi:hypothetical protein
MVTFRPSCHAACGHSPSSTFSQESLKETNIEPTFGNKQRLYVRPAQRCKGRVAKLQRETLPVMRLTDIHRSQNRLDAHVATPR